MSDRAEIVEVCTRMAVHADRREWDELAGVFAPSVTLDYTSLNGGEPAVLTPAEIVTAWSGFLGAFDATQHLVTNHLVTAARDSAVCTASFQATHVLANRFGSPLWTLGGDYEFRLVRVEGSWRIAGVVMTVVWADGNKDLLALAAAGGAS